MSDAPETAAVAGGAEAPASAGSNLLDLVGLGNYIEARWLLNLIAAVLALILAVVLYRVLLRGVRHLCANHTLLESLRDQMTMTLRWVYWPIAVLFVLQQAGVEVTGLLTIITGVLAMVAIGFIAVWSMASNVSAGFLVVSTRLFRVGDYVQFTNTNGDDGFVGRVKELRLLNTVLEEIRKDGRQTGGAQVRIPNNLFFQHPVRVSSQEPPFLGEIRDEAAQKEDHKPPAGADPADDQGAGAVVLEALGKPGEGRR